MITDVSNPFTIEFGDDAIADLRARLVQTRWPERETVDDWSQGVPLAHVQELCGYWATEYDFAAAKGRLNRFAQYRTAIDGLDIHFLHVPSEHADAMPVVLTHGWPGSFVEFLGVIDALANPEDPDDAFHVVVPSLPGFGYSDKPSAPGWNLTRVAAAWDALMLGLGYDRYGAQGGDVGALLANTIARDFADHLTGIHLNLPVLDLTTLDRSDLTSEEQDGLERVAAFARDGRGYAEVQSTRPQTLGYGLTDSPAGQCAWILDKYWAWTDCDGHPELALTREQMLDNISVYWFSRTAASSARTYWENRDRSDLAPIAVPAGLSVFPKEIITVSQRMAKTRYRDLRWFHRLDHGGHFAAWEQPALFVDELRAFFRTVR
jgi:pimeloyl-ACP methyl ester carboxylesterase